MTGSFIAFEGGDGGGKSTQVALLAAALRDRGHTVVTTREPGGSPRAEQIRALLLADGPIDERAEALLFAAARADHVRATIAPALAAGAIVITDRFVDSGTAYQGVARGVGVAAIRELNDWATAGLTPGLTVVLDLAPEAGLARAQDGNRIEAETLAFHRGVRQAFLDLAAADPARYLVLDATAARDVIAAEVLTAALDLIGGRR